MQVSPTLFNTLLTLCNLIGRKQIGIDHVDASLSLIAGYGETGIFEQNDLNKLVDRLDKAGLKIERVTARGRAIRRERDHELDQTEEVEAAEEKPVETVVEESTVDEDAAYRARLLKYDEHPGLLWDPVDEEWVNDPDYGGDE